MEHYAIKKMKSFCRVMRDEAIKIISDPTIKNDIVDEFITIEQCVSIVTNKCPQDEDGEYYLNEDIYFDIIEDIAKQIYQSALSKLAAEDIVQCAWDDTNNEMVFWLNDQN